MESQESVRRFAIGEVVRIPDRPTVEATVIGYGESAVVDAAGARRAGMVKVEWRDSVLGGGTGWIEERYLEPMPE